MVRAGGQVERGVLGDRPSAEITAPLVDSEAWPCRRCPADSAASDSGPGSGEKKDILSETRRERPSRIGASTGPGGRPATLASGSPGRGASSLRLVSAPVGREIAEGLEIGVGVNEFTRVEPFVEGRRNRSTVSRPFPASAAIRARAYVACPRVQPGAPASHCSITLASHWSPPLRAARAPNPARAFTLAVSNGRQAFVPGAPRPTRPCVEGALSWSQRQGLLSAVAGRPRGAPVPVGTFSPSRPFRFLRDVRGRAVQRHTFSARRALTQQQRIHQLANLPRPPHPSQGYRLAGAWLSPPPARHPTCADNRRAR